MKNLYIREWLTPTVFIAFSMLLEIVNYLSLGIGVFPTYFLFDLAVIFIYLGFLYLAPIGGKVWISLTSIFLFIQVVLNILNYTINNSLGEIFNLSMLTLSSEGAKAFEWRFINWGIVALNFAIFIAFIALSIYMNKTLATKKYSKKSRFIIIMSIFIALQSIGTSTFYLQSHALKRTNTNEETITDYDIWNNVFLKVEAFKRFGTFGFYIKNIGDYLFTPNKLKNDVKLEIDMKILEGRDKNPVSQYHGIAKDDNVIMLLLESFDSFAIDPINTPFLWSLINGDAVYMNNYHSKNKTNISEAISFVGNSPYDKLLYDYAYNVGVDVPNSLPNIYQNIHENSSVNFFHGYSKYFYRRSFVNPLLGFQNVYAMEDCTLDNKSHEYGDWILDSEFIDNMMNLFIPQNQKFFSYYTSITTHGSYGYDNHRLYNNIDYVKSHFTEYENYVKNETDFVIPVNKIDREYFIQYKSACKDTDDMVKNIFTHLKNSGLLDKTTIIMMGDHYCFMNDLSYKVKNINLDDVENPKLYNVPFIIYNDELQGGINDAFCNSYDIYPTICDLMDIKYNNNLVQGYSVFSDAINDSVLVSFQNGMCTDKLFTYDSQTITKLSDTVTDSEIERFKKNIALFYKKQDTIEKIYNYNYFKYPHPDLVDID